MHQEISVVVGGYRWVGAEVRSVGSVIAEMMDSAGKELLLTVLSSYDVIEHIYHAPAGGVSVRVIMNSSDNQMPEIVRRLRDPEKEYPWWPGR